MTKKLFKYILPYRLRAIAAILLMASEVISELMQPALMARIVDFGIKNGDIPFIVRQGILMLLIALFGIVGGIGCAYFASKAGYGYAADLRLDLFSKIQKLSFGDIDKFSTSSLVTRLTNDVVQIQNIVQMLLRIMVRAPLMGIGGIIMAFIINARLSLVLIAIVPLLAVTVTFIIRKSFPVYGLVQARIDKVNSVMRENLSGIRVVKAFAREEHEAQRFDGASEELCKKSIKAGRIVNLTNPLMTFVMNMGMIAVVWFGGVGVNNGSIRTGEVMALINYLTQILFSLMVLGFLFVSLSRARVSGVRICEVLDAEPEVEVKPEVEPKFEPDVEPGVETGCSIEFKNVSFSYTGKKDQNVLEDINIKIASGEKIAVIGSTGSGKTTLANLIPRFYELTEGEIKLNGKCITEYSLARLRQKIGIVLQDSVLFTGSIKENIKWGNREASDDEIYRAAEAAEAHEFTMSFPDGYETLLGQRGVNLSGGQKQRLCIARALLAKPDLLILDDSLSAVDVVTGSKIQKTLRKILMGTTCIMIAQRVNTVMNADRIIVMDEGKIEGVGTHAQLMENSVIYRDIYDSQLGGRDVV